MIFYHSTNKKNLKNILKQGLLKSKANHWQRAGGCVYLSDEPVWLNEQKDIVILKIEIPNNVLKNIECYRLDDWQHICYENIDKKYIKEIVKK